MGRFTDQFDTFHQAAAATIGSDDFGSDDYHDALGLLLKSLDDNDRLTETGVTVASEIIVGLLAGRLMTEAGLQRNPSAADTPIEKPLIITGLPRSGTTVLHRLFTVDQTIQSLPFWLAGMPMARPPRETWEQNPVFQQVKRRVDQLDIDSPGFRQIHPIYADLADECRWAIDQSFWSATIAAGFTVPEYMDWVLRGEAGYAYRYHRRLLSVVADGDGRRWMLKDPSHIMALESLLEVYPDACIILTHREPARAFSSICSLVWHFRMGREEQTTREQVGQEMIRIWSTAMNRTEQLRSESDAGRIIDIHIDETRRAPIRTMHRIYEYFGLTASDEANAAWSVAIRKDPSQGHGEHHHSLEEYGLTEDMINRAICDEYHERLANLKTA